MCTRSRRSLLSIFILIWAERHGRQMRNYSNRNCASFSQSIHSYTCYSAECRRTLISNNLCDKSRAQIEKYTTQTRAHNFGFGPKIEKLTCKWKIILWIVCDSVASRVANYAWQNWQSLVCVCVSLHFLSSEFFVSIMIFHAIISIIQQITEWLLWKIRVELRTRRRREHVLEAAHLHESDFAMSLNEMFENSNWQISECRH